MSRYSYLIVNRNAINNCLYINHYWKKDLLHCGLLTFKSKWLVDTSNTKAAARECTVKKEFLKILQNSKESTCVRVWFNKVAGPATLLKRESITCVFLWILWNFLKTPISKTICKQLLLNINLKVWVPPIKRKWTS